MTDDGQLPRWELGGFFPPVAEAAFVESMERIREEVAGLQALFDQRDIGGHPTAESARSSAANFDEVMRTYLEVRTRLYHMEAYLECLTAGDSRDDVAQARLSELQPTLASINLLQTRLTARAARPGSGCTPR